MPERNLDDWLKLLEVRHPVEIELGLERIAQVAVRLNLPRLAAKVVVVAGTNGKGSCVRGLEMLAMAAELRVAAYTSPHLVCYNERLRIQGLAVADARLCQAFETIEAVRDEISLTYFEMGTLAAMVLMAEQPLDLAILEVGLGGRFDAVNIVDADVAIITAIDIDHSAWLGDTRELIAVEKAGIARAGIPAVCSDENPPRALVSALENLGAIPFFIGADFWGESSGSGVHACFKMADGSTREFAGLPQPNLPLPSVLAAAQTAFLLDYPLSRDMLAAVFDGAELAGRYQSLVFRGRKIVLDVAHNPAAALMLAKRLSSESRTVYCVAGIMADKDAAGFIDAMRPVVRQWFVGDLAVDRAMPARDLAALLVATSPEDSPCEVVPYDTIEGAFNQALAKCGDDGMIVVCGSFHTVSAIMQVIECPNPGRKYDL